jgi:hypothetical protein
MADYQLMGNTILSAGFTEDMDENVKTRLIQLVKLVSSYVTFETSTKIADLLGFDVSLTPSSSVINDLSTACTNVNIATGTQGTVTTGLNTNTLLDVASKTNFIVSESNRVTSQTIATAVKTSLAASVSNLTTNSVKISSGQAADIQKHQDAISNACVAIWEKIYTNIETNSKLAVPKITLINDCPTISSAYFAIHANTLLTHLKNNLVDTSKYFNEYNRTDSYYTSICKLIISYSKTVDNDVLRKPIVINTFLTAFYPYFVFMFITSQIAKITEASNDKAPRIFIARRIAVITAYMFEIYFAIALLKYFPTDASGITQIVSNIQTLIKQEKIKTVTTYDSIHQTTQNNISDSKVITDNNRDITMSRNNLNKALVNDIGVNKQVGKSKAGWILSLVLLLITGCACVGMIMFLPKEKLEFVYIFIGIVFLILAIAAIVRMVKAGI